MKVTLDDLEKAYKTAIDALKIQMGYPLEQELQLLESVEALSSPLVDFNDDAEVDYMQRTDYVLLEETKELQNSILTDTKRILAYAQRFY